MAPMEYTPMVYRFNGKGMVSRKILFRSGNGHGKICKKKNTIKDTMSKKLVLCTI